MTKLFLSLILLTSSLALVPHAAAECDPTGAVCAYTLDGGYGDCFWYGQEQRYTGVYVTAPGGASASALGGTYCSRGQHSAYTAEGVSAGVMSDATGGISLQWAQIEQHGVFTSYSKVCYVGIYVEKAETYREVACPVPPPNPGWGDLLP